MCFTSPRNTTNYNRIRLNLKFMTQSSTELKRHQGARREGYISTAPPEEFIVPLLKEHIENLLETYANKNNSRDTFALDVGCGRQPFRSNLEKAGYIYKSLDAVQNPEKSIDFICQLDKALPHEIVVNIKYDFILCTEVMEHIAEWDIAFNNLAQLLKTGGILLITCPHFYFLHEVPHDFWRATPYALQHFGNKYNLKILHQVSAGNAWDILGTLLSVSYCLPMTRKIGDRILSRFISFLIKFIFNLLRDRKLQKSVDFKSQFYMSNIIIFEKL